MAQEIERKFLVSGEFKSLATSHSRIVQGYISSARGRTVRVRIRDDKGYLTIKGASNASGTSRYEWEKELPLAEAEELMKLCEPGIIDKTRYLVRSGKHVFEVDEFYGENEGLGAGSFGRRLFKKAGHHRGRSEEHTSELQSH